MKIYIASLSDYNEGRLIGEWVDLSEIEDVYDIEEKIEKILEKSKCEIAEDWSIHDYEDVPNFGENPDLEKIVNYCEMYKKHGEAWKAFCNLVGEDYATQSDFEGQYKGEYESKEKFAEELAENCDMFNGWSETAQLYFDWDAWTRDLFLDGYSSEKSQNGIFVFSNC